ncbi:putative disease resistance protein At4g19050 [Lactuca sativa]|uniref:putative disease resistance protein At4g19050 n=1 Tax=Lactuca sativa TaxID=4236 RepID=UPI0022AE739E|nr:putative disease resistance protein At4g19050 [Lactuca sativa]
MEDLNSQNNSGKEKVLSSIQHVSKICASIKDHKKVNLFGPPGVGKTWMAKRVSELATRMKIVHVTLWVFMCKEYTKESLSKSIAQQLCLLPTTYEEWEDGDENKELKDNDDKVQDSETLIKEIKKKLEEKEILLILDDVHLDHETEHDSNETKFWSLWNEMFPNENFKTLLISRLKREHEDISDAIEVEAFPKEESDALLIGKLDAQLRKKERILNLGKTLIEKSDGFPGTVIMIAKSLNYFGVDESRMSILEKELEETSREYSVNKLLCMKHDVLPISILKDLWWSGHHFFRDSASVHYNELITYWILEGYLGFGSMTSLYNKGHGIVMELMDYGVLKGLEGDYVFMDKSLINVDDLYQYVDQNANLGLATVFTSDVEGFGRITHEDGMLKTPRRTRTKVKNQEQKESSSKEVGQNLSTLLLDGTHFSDQVMMNFLKSEKELQVLALFNPTIKSLPNSLDMMEKLRVLVLRGCEFLQDVKLPLKALRVLEISGGRSLRSLKSIFFKNMVNLQSIHLSGLQISYLPQAFYNLLELRWLVIKDCRRLKKLESLSKLEHLLVVDLSGNIVLDTVDKNFLKFKNLQSLNLSNTLVSTTPLLKNIESLTHLLCRGCKGLGRLRGLTSLTSLQTLDLSGSIEFEEFHDSSLQSLRSLKTLDLSETAIDRLPSNISDPRSLYLKSCPLLERLPCIESLRDLEVLDVSGSKNLKEFEKGFFDRLTDLRVLNLSETNVVDLPSLSWLSNLRELYLSRCPSLKRLPSLESATKLEILDASWCIGLDDIGNQSFEGKTRLQKIDLSETKIESFPSLSNPSHLRQLLLKNCKALKSFELNVSLPNLEELNLSGVTLKPNGAEFMKDMSNIQILDLSNTSLEQIPSISKFTNLTRLSLAGCSCSDAELDLKPLSKLEVLNLSGSSIKRLTNLTGSHTLQKLLLQGCSIAESSKDDEFKDLLGSNPKIPDAMSELSHLDHIEFPNVNYDTSHEESSSKETNQEQCSICRLSEDDKAPIFTSGSQFLEILKENPLQEKSHLCAVPYMVEGEIGDRYLQRHELVFRDVYLQACGFPQYKGNKSLQIRGFNHFPKGIENIICKVNMVFLIDNKFNGLPSEFDVSKLKEVKGCWIDRCDETITIFTEKEGDESSNSPIFLENLGISNNRRLESIYNGKQASGSFDSLKSLYLESCPKLSVVFQSSWLPKNLEVLEIKHCDKIVSLFDQTDQGILPSLKTLHLWELSELESIGLSFPKLQTLKIWECPKVKQIERIFQSSHTLETLSITGATSLKSLDGISCLRFLSTLILESCPMLEYVASFLDSVKTIEIKSCEKLQILFTRMYYMPDLDTLHFEDLPMLKKIGVTFPSIVTIITYECPNLNLKGTIVD